jgi:RNA polymerase sigma-70 factor, ECF subfamily
MSSTDAEASPQMRDSQSSFAQLLDRLQAGDQDAAREIHRVYTPRLVALARLQFAPDVLRRADPESVVQSVYRSFFRRERNGQFVLGDWDDLWGLLSLITLRKCANRTRYFRRECRDVGRESPIGRAADDSNPGFEPTDPGPTPLEAAVLCETVEALFLDLSPRERSIIEGLLQGGTIEEVRSAVGCGERTVRRVRDRVRGKLARMQLLAN